MTNNTIYAASVIAMIVGISVLAYAATDTFSVSLVVQNQAPEVFFVNGTLSYTPTANSTTALFEFNYSVRDENGAANINDTAASIVITHGTGDTASNVSCTPSDNGNIVDYNCTVIIPYYYEPGSYTINASIYDNDGQFAENTSQTFTLNELTAIELLYDSINFPANDPGTQNVAATENPQRVRNTGNFNASSFNVTAYDLRAGSSNDYIGADNFTVNVADGGGAGDVLQNATQVAVSSYSLDNGLDSNETLYTYVDIPSGVTPDTYTSESDWIVHVS